MSDNQGITPPHLQGFGSPSAGATRMSEPEFLIKEIIGVIGRQEESDYEVFEKALKYDEISNLISRYYSRKQAQKTTHDSCYRRVCAICGKEPQE